MSDAVAAVDFSFDQLEAVRPAPAPRDPAGAAAEADALIAGAQARADELRRTARQEGFEQGYEAAMQAAREECEPLAAALGEAVREAAALRTEAADAAERRAVELALQIAEKAVAGAIEVEPERVIDAVRGALRCLVERERVTVLVNTLDLELVREAVDSLRSQLGGMEHIEVQEERRVARGGAKVRSQAGEVDASIETKLERAREVVAAELRR
ncbi:MAG: FliH/SctL family protein [Thermoleophilaceae bacterium]